ncbi:sensor domain-containing diguanylate cyclase [Anaerosporobacter sp.]|uniref:sensor domain-containing diguanylate cyclase n=1 Tax=Anaerosporobacter sp. TaxID=1872529 RepID=UPI00286EE536|nr:sensor domain-containing diguanylate cyclase [Anaerosporobacter sp.]
MREQELHSLLNHLPGGIFTCSNDERLSIQDCNHNFLQLFGYDSIEQLREETGGSFLQLLYEADREEALAKALQRRDLITNDNIFYRGVRKDGSLVWIHDQGHLYIDNDHEYFYCVLQDNSYAMRATEDLRLSLERHQIILNQTNDVLFEWDLVTDSLFVSSNWEKKFGYSPNTIKDGLLSRFRSHIHPDDQASQQALVDNLRAGTPMVEATIRIATVTGEWLWCRERGTAQFDDHGKVIRAVGCIVDIDRDKRYLDEMRNRAEHDSLTNLCNKITTQSQITAILSVPHKKHIYALVLLDVDNFKMVNNVQGHLAGDVLLIDLAKKIKKNAHTRDICGRVGGDEFAMLLCGNHSREEVACQVQKILDDIATLQPNFDVPFSCSAGIALFPENGTNYTTLFTHADTALYQSKHNGKSGYTFYSPELEQNTNTYTGTTFDNHDASAFTSQLSMYFFHQLYLTDDIETAIPKVLEIAGKLVDVSRVYISEENEDNTAIISAYEWCNEGVASMEDMLINMTPIDMAVYKERLSIDGFISCTDVTKLTTRHQELLAPKGVSAILHCGLYQNGQYRGFVGFDKCEAIQAWTQEQLDVLKQLSEILGMFLSRQHEQLKSAHTLNLLEMVLDSMDHHVYVVDAEDFHLVYANKLTRSLLPEDAIGHLCHRDLCGLNEPCELCPIKSIQGSDKTEYQCTMFNPLTQRRVSVKAVKLIWAGGQAVYLVTPVNLDI